jgi:hypothetical protein
MRGQRHAPATLYPWERPGTHCTGEWVGPRADLDRCGKSRPPPGFDPQPVASCYTDYATRPTSGLWVTKILERVFPNIFTGGPLFDSKNNHGASHPCSHKYIVSR